MADDFSNDVNTTGQLAVGGTRTANFEASSDSDWFKVSLTAGTTYQFTLNGALHGGGSLPSYSGVSLSLMGQQGYALAFSSYVGAGQAPLMQYTAPSSGTYYLAAQSGNGQLGTYRVAAILPAADDYAADTTTTGTIDAEGTVAGNFERSDDTDWFRFHADAGQITTFTTATGDGMLTPSYFYIYDGSGKSVAYLQAQYGFVAGLGGDYFVSLSAGGGQIGKYAATMHVVSDDYSADNTRAGTLSAGGEASGTLDYRDDSDRFLLDVRQGQFYTVTLSTKPGAAQQLALSVTDGAGGYVATTSNYADGTLTLRVLANGTGTYALNVGNGYANNVGAAYTLTASSPEADDFGGTMGSATALSLGLAVSGKVQSSDDVDMFKVSLSAGVTYRVDMVMDGGGSNYNFRMTDGGGNAVGQSLYNAQTFFSYTPTKGGDFYLSQSGSYGVTSALGYTVKVSAALDDFSANTATQGRLSVGASTKGELEAGGGDADWYAVTLDAGGYYWFSVDGAREGGGTLSNYNGATVRLLDAHGAVLATSAGTYNTTSTTLPYTAATKGTYYVEVASLGGAGTYTVKARLGEADDHGNDIAHATAIGAAAKGKLELTSDVDMFKFTAEAGVTYQLVLAPGSDGGISMGSYATLEVSTGSNEFVYARSVYSSVNQVRLFEAGKTGDYYFKVGSAYGGTGSYVLSVASLGKDDFPASNLTTAVVEPGKPLQGVIGVADDHDWVKVSLEAGRTYVFDLQGTLSGGGTLDTSNSSAGMSLIGRNGYAVAHASSAVGGEPRLSYIATASGDYYLDVHGDGSKSGTYTVVATLTSGDVSAPHLLSSSIQDGAVDVSPVMPKVVLGFDEIVMVGSGLTLTDGNGVEVKPSGYGQALATAVGKTLVIEPHLNLKPGVTYTLSLPEGSVLDLAGNKLAGALSYKFTIAAPVTSGTSGNDFMLGGQGLKLDGGAGVDTVYYGGTLNYGYSLLHNTDGSYTFRDYGSQAGGDTLIGVERLLLAGSAIALDIDGTGGQVYRLYQAAFNRAPDSVGLGFWMAAMDRGLTHAKVAEGFTLSAEFITQYGAAPSDADFVNLLYKNVLHRAPDADGKSFWLDHLAHDTTRAQALAYFSESPENTAAAAVIIGNGFSYTPYG